MLRDPESTAGMACGQQPEGWGTERMQATRCRLRAEENKNGYDGAGLYGTECQRIYARTFEGWSIRQRQWEQPCSNVSEAVA